MDPIAEFLFRVFSNYDQVVKMHLGLHLDGKAVFS